MNVELKKSRVMKEMLEKLADYIFDEERADKVCKFVITAIVIAIVFHLIIK